MADKPVKASATRRERRKERTLQDLSKIFPDMASIDANSAEYSKDGNDKSVALLTSAMLDTFLRETIRAHIIVGNPALQYDETADIFFSMNAPLSSFSAKIDLSYLLGICDNDARHDLNIIRRIRNAFAHAVIPITFETDEVAKECKKLKINSTKIKGLGSRNLFLNSYIGLVDMLWPKIQEIQEEFRRS